MSTPPALQRLNTAPPAALAEQLRACAPIESWVRHLITARPYPCAESLLAEASDRARRWTPDEVHGALAHHPRIGERPLAAGAEADASRAEQASMASAAGETAAAIAAGNARYEERFGRVFLIRAAGRSPEQMRAELDRRLGNDDEGEAAEALDQLRQIALLRLEGAIA